jgi:nicotinamide mononucleotide transporter
MHMFLHQNKVKMAGIVLFTIGSIALLAGSWLHIIPFSITEDLGFITGALTVWLTVLENIWTFPVGIANNLFFFVLFLHAGLFAAMSLQVIYIILSLQGWSLWSRRRKNKTVLHISSVAGKELCILAGITLIAICITLLYLQKIQDAAPLWDAITTVLSLVAQYMLNKKLLENWYVWIIADIIYVPMYAFGHLYLTSVVYLTFLIMSFVGLIVWRQSKMRMSVLNGYVQ